MCALTACETRYTRGRNEKLSEIRVPYRRYVDSSVGDVMGEKQGRYVAIERGDTLKQRKLTSNAREIGLIGRAMF